MEFVFPASMLALGLIVGTLSIWFITRTKLKYEFDRGRATGDSERATLTERLAGKEDQLRELREACERMMSSPAAARGDEVQFIWRTISLALWLRAGRQSDMAA